MEKKINKVFIKELSHSLFFDFSDEQLGKIVNDIQRIDQHLKQSNYDKLIGSYTPVTYTRVVNCAKFRRDDEPDKIYDKDYLSNAKRADKYVIGK